MLIETHKAETYLLPLNLFIKDSKKLDAIWASLLLSLKAVSIDPHFFGVGDYQTIVAISSIELILGSELILFSS